MNSRPTILHPGEFLPGMGDETVIHTEAVNASSVSNDSPVLLSGFWVVAGLILVGIGIAAGSQKGALLAWMR